MKYVVVVVAATVVGVEVHRCHEVAGEQEADQNVLDTQLTIVPAAGTRTRHEKHAENETMAGGFRVASGRTITMMWSVVPVIMFKCLIGCHSAHEDTQIMRHC